MTPTSTPTPSTRSAPAGTTSGILTTALGALIVFWGHVKGYARELYDRLRGVKPQYYRPLTVKEQKRRLWRQWRASLPPMSGRRWVKIRKFAQRQAKLRTQYAAMMRQRQAAR